MSYILWEGASLFDGSPLVLLGTDRSKNEKTGPMLQTYILRSDMHPANAVRTYQDGAICGDCPLRGIDGGERICYVSLYHGVSTAWKSYADGRARRVPHEQFVRRQPIRMGAYGDPAAVPIEVWQSLLRRARGHTGYTHAWRTCDQRFRGLLMASCDNPEDYVEAKALGWATYRLLMEGEARMPGERPCPANKATGVSCSVCRQCNGQRRDFTILVHGGSGQSRKYRTWRLASLQ
jgi:hypothetical protein